MTGISALGIGSGLNLSGILDKLTKAEKNLLTPISKQQSDATAKLSAYGTLKTAVQSFQTANDKLRDGGLFTATSTVSTSSAFSADSDGSAIPGKYTINVQQLAQSHMITSGIKGDTRSVLGSDADTRTLKVTLADGKEKSITLSKDQTSLSALRASINTSNAGITANIIRVSDTGYRLSVTSSETGTSNAVKSVEITGDDILHRFLGYSAGTPGGGMTENAAARNAKLTVNNVDIESGSNTISNVVEGVTIKLNDQTTGNQTLIVSSDTSRAKTAITEWVNLYNSLLDTMGNLAKYTPVDKGKDQDSKNGALLGDGTLHIIRTALKSILAGSSGSAVYKSLSQAGISTNPANGKLKIDDKKLSSTLTVKPEVARDMFTGDGKKTGIATGLSSRLTSILGSKGGLQGATDNISKKLNRLTDKYNATSQRIDDTIARYKTQFTRLDKMVSKLNSVSSYLTQQFITGTKKHS